MIINSAPQNEATISNVVEINEFKIRATAKSFSILSSGLYQNKIRAIIRELSCNALDSHVAAGKKDVPFELHLPTFIEPWFSIRDFGTGLSHEQVTNLYTTYFESTKTDSNDFVGALGLGSKSPFSYTDNFTVTAIKDGKKGLYSAFINNIGVPSIAQMLAVDTTEENGVEVKFAVEENKYSFASEAQQVLKYFPVVPKMTGEKIIVVKPEYKEKDIIPGVHYTDVASNAVMGNISYPINIPNSLTESFGDLKYLLNFGIEMHFNIGELDFQASREGLSYIQLTIDSIKSKLTALDATLTKKVSDEIAALTNVWERCNYVTSKVSLPLYDNIVRKYLKSNPVPEIDVNGHATRLKINANDLIDKYNIQLSGYTHYKHKYAASVLHPHSSHVMVNNLPVQEKTWHFNINSTSFFVKNVDNKCGAIGTSKHHFNSALPTSTYTVYILSAHDPKKEAKYDEFFADLLSPPENQIFELSKLKQKAKPISAKVTTSGMIKRLDYNFWDDAFDLSVADENVTYYYVPLSFSSPILSVATDIKDVNKIIKSKLFSHSILYGVRSRELKKVQKLKNWINAEVAIKEAFKTITLNDILYDQHMQDSVLVKYINPIDIKCPDHYLKKITPVKCTDKYNFGSDGIRYLRIYGPEVFKEYQSILELKEKVNAQLLIDYPMLKYTSMYNFSQCDIVDVIVNYINLVDSTKVKEI